MTPEEYILARMPNVDTDRVVQLLPLALDEVGENWGTCRDKAVALLVLHWISLENMGGGSSTVSPGLITGVKEGDLSIEKDGVPSIGYTKGEFPLSSTQFGQEFVRLKRGCFVLPRTRLV